MSPGCTTITWAARTIIRQTGKRRGACSGQRRTCRLAALENREFLKRAMPFLVAEQGIRQFVDIGPGLPTQGNVHQLAGSTILARMSSTSIMTPSC